MPPETRRRGFADQVGAAAGRALTGVSNGAGLLPAVNRLLASAVSGTATVVSTSEARFVDEDQAVTSYGPTPLLDGAPASTRWLIHAYVLAKSEAPAIGGLTIIIGNTEPNLRSAEWAGTVTGEQELSFPGWTFYAADSPHVLAGWTGDPIDTLELHVRADRL